MIHSDAAARTQLTRLVNDALLTFRGQYAMLGGLNWSVVDVSRAVLTVGVFATGRAAADPLASATKLRNCARAFLRGILPSESFVARIRTSQDAGAPVREIVLPYASYLGSLENNAVLIEEVCEPKRAQLRLATAPLLARLAWC